MQRAYTFLLLAVLIMASCNNNVTPTLPLPPAPDTELSEEMLAFCGDGGHDIYGGKKATIFIVSADGSNWNMAQGTYMEDSFQIDNLSCTFPGFRDSYINYGLAWDAAGETLYFNVENRPPHALDVSPDGVPGTPYQLWKTPSWQDEVYVSFNNFYYVDISPDGELLVFVGGRFDADNSSKNVWTTDLDGSNMMRLTDNMIPDFNYEGTVWSPDGEWIASSITVRENGVAILSRDGAQQFVLTEKTMPSILSEPNLNYFWTVGFYDLTPSWYPDSRWVVFVAVAKKGGRVNALFSYDLDSGQVEKLIDNNVYMPTVSPTGEWIAYISYFGESNRREAAIMLADQDGQHAVELLRLSHSEGRKMVVRDLVWSPNGTRLAFTSNHEGDLDIYVMNADGTNLLNVTDREGFEVMPRWRPHPLDD